MHVQWSRIIRVFLIDIECRANEGEQMRGRWEARERERDRAEKSQKEKLGEKRINAQCTFNSFAGARVVRNTCRTPDIKLGAQAASLETQNGAANLLFVQAL